MDCAGHGAWCRDKISVFNQDPLVNPNTDGFRIGYSIDTKFGSYERNSGGKREITNFQKYKIDKLHKYKLWAD